MSYIYGPVPSRRLGFSLGIDLVPFKTCSLDCIYCQLGRTTQKTVERKEYIPVDEVLAEIERALSLHQRIDYITFSGSGEPTLNSGIGKLIKEVKGITPIPVVVLTNGTLLFQETVRKALSKADLVVPSLDVATQLGFERVNRPHPRLKLAEVIEGLVSFRRAFTGRIWLEVMLVKGINDGGTDLIELKRMIERIEPDRVQLNTVVRPPAEPYAQPLGPDELKRVQSFLGKGCEIIVPFDYRREAGSSPDIEKAVMQLIRRRPVTLSDLSVSLGVNPIELSKCLANMKERELLKVVNYGGKQYYESIG
jgi:wyosine [tRNA(Phe)-imidazoG37] synthetase (radical SAM superfamily)